MTEFLEKLIQIIREFIAKQENRETPDPTFEGLAILGIIVGHTKRSPGAVFNAPQFNNEYDYNDHVAKIAKEYADKAYPSMKVHIIYRDLVGRSGAYKKAESLNCDMVVELHFNAFNTMVTGTETLTTAHQGDKAYADKMQKMMTSVFGRGGNSRGVKVLSKGARGYTNVSLYPKGYNCLVEPFFGDNASEAKKAVNYAAEYGRGLVDASAQFAKNYLGILK